MADSLAMRGQRALDRDCGHVPRATVTKMSSISPQKIQWLWPMRIALGKLTMIAGDPGLGKSMLTTNIIAHATQGRSWPDGTACPQGSAIIISGEDDPADTIRPRLDAAGADVDRVHLLEAIHVSGRERGFTLADVVPLAGLLDEIADCKLIVIDPVSAYLAGIDSHKNSDIRALLTPLVQMAAAHKAAVIAVSHLNKAQAGSAMSRVTGSLAFVAQARAAFVVARDPDEPARRLFLPLKNNIGNDRTGLSYHISEDLGVPYVVWDRGEVTMGADEALAPKIDNGNQRASIGEAAEFLADQLKNLPVSVDDLQREAKAAGISWSTVKRAKGLIGAKSRKSGFDKGAWVWFLPPNAKMLSRTDKKLSFFGGVELLREKDAHEEDQTVEGAEEDQGFGVRESEPLRDCTAAEYRAARDGGA